MKILGNRIHAAPVILEHIGGIVIPESLKQAHIGNYKLWRVLQTGPGRLTRKGVCVPIECSPGDRLVTVTGHTGPHELPDGTAIISWDEVLAVIPRL